MPGDMGLPRPDPECTESEDSEEFEVDLCFLPPNSFIVPPSSPLLNFVSGWGTNMTDTQLSSESMDVSLWILPSLLEESDPVSPFDNFLSLSEMKFKVIHSYSKLFIALFVFSIGSREQNGVSLLTPVSDSVLLLFQMLPCQFILLCMVAHSTIT